MPSDDPRIAALLRERAGLVSRGLTDRVEQIDEELEHRGYSDEGGQRSEPPQGRSSEPLQTADAGKPDAKAVREWAAANGLECPAKGRIPDALMELYVEAQQG